MLLIRSLKRKNLCAGFLAVILSIACLQQAKAIETIVIDKANTQAIPIAINRFETVTTQDHRTSDDIISVITNDLKNSGLFRPISRSAFIEKKVGIVHKPLFAAWRQINSNLLVNGQIEQVADGNIKISFILWDSVLEKDIAGQEFEVNPKLWRRVAHKISDKIYESITGDAGYFDTKIAYISETGPRQKRTKKLAIMDQDGANHQYLTDGKTLVLTPIFSPKGDKLLYVSYSKKTPRVYMRNLASGKDILIGNFSGMSFAPCFSHDEGKMLMSIAKDGNTHIFEVNFHNKRIKQLTFGSSINTSPSYSPDDRRIVFNSDRSGSRQLYIMNSDGSNVQRISFGSGKYAEPKWSPRGDYIAFTKITAHYGFVIGVMRPVVDPENNGERIIANGYLVENSSWAPSGRVIVFAKAEAPRGRVAGKSRLHTIDITGYNERELPTPQDASGPDWSYSLR